MGSMTEDGKFEGTKGHAEARVGSFNVQGDKRRELLEAASKKLKPEVIKQLTLASIKGMMNPAETLAHIYAEIVITEALRTAFLEGFMSGGGMPEETYQDGHALFQEAAATGIRMGNEIAADLHNSMKDKGEF